MPINKMTVAPASELKWGQLVRTWATGAPQPGEFLGEDPALLQRPTTLDELRDRCRALGISINITGFTSLTISQPPDRNTFAIHLPAKDAVNDVIASFNADGPYGIPAFYSKLFGAPAPDLAKDKKIEFQALRIGDYTIGNCGD